MHWGYRGLVWKIMTPRDSYPDLFLSRSLFVTVFFAFSVDISLCRLSLGWRRVRRCKRTHGSLSMIVSYILSYDKCSCINQITHLLFYRGISSLFHFWAKWSTSDRVLHLLSTLPLSTTLHTSYRRPPISTAITVTLLHPKTRLTQ